MDIEAPFGGEKTFGSTRDDSSHATMQACRRRTHFPRESSDSPLNFY
jgi:hypothetical protein